MRWIERWMLFHSVIILVSSFAFLLTKNILFIALSAVISFAALFVWHFIKKGSFSFILEAANLVTSFRLLSLIFLLFFLPHISDLMIGGIAFFVLLFDGLDGYLARRFKTSSVFGTYLDMETDAFFVLALSSVLFYQTKFGLWILALGWLRYVYFIGISILKPVEKKEARDYFAQVIAVIFMGSLVACFILPESIYVPAMVIASLLLLFSFGKSFLAVFLSRY